MRYRRLDPETGDYCFGSGLTNFWIDTPEAVAQSVLTRLMLWSGQWFANLDSGTPWLTEVLGERTQTTRDLVVRERTRTTTGVSEVVAYNSHLDRNARAFAATMQLNTVYGMAALGVGNLPVDTLPTLPAPFHFDDVLGIVGRVTPVVMTPANLSQDGPAAMIREFRIDNMDAGAF